MASIISDCTMLIHILRDHIVEIGRKSKTTILAVTHDLNWAAMDFDRIIGMSHGRVIADDTPSAFMTSENLHRIFDAHWTVQPHPESGHPIVLPAHHYARDL